MGQARTKKSSRLYHLRSTLVAAALVRHRGKIGTGVSIAQLSGKSRLILLVTAAAQHLKSYLVANRCSHM